MAIMSEKEQYIQIFEQKIIPVREGADKLLEWILSTDFFEAPASTKYHGAFEGGLCQHSLSVYNRLLNLNQCYQFGFAEDTMALVALCHDLCKCEFYKTRTRNVKDDVTGQWKKVPYYTIEEQWPYGFHGPKSTFIVQNYVKLSKEEGAAIACHMGFSDQTNMTSISNVYNKFKLAWALHVADEDSTWVVGV